MYIYTTEIKAMLYSFGDLKNPSSSTAMAIERILKTQIRRFLSAANDVRILRRGKSLNLEDISFVIRKDPFKLQRLLNYVDFKEIKGKMDKQDEIDDPLFLLSDKKTKKYAWMKDNVGIDNFQLNRLSEIDKLTASMTKDEYLYFTECRQSSFVYRKSKKFREFLNFQNLSESILDLIGYICYEIVYFMTYLVLKRKKTRGNITQEEIENVAYEMSKDGKLFF